MESKDGDDDWTEHNRNRMDDYADEWDRYKEKEHAEISESFKVLYRIGLFGLLGILFAFGYRVNLCVGFGCGMICGMIAIVMSDYIDQWFEVASP